MHFRVVVTRDFSMDWMKANGGRDGHNRYSHLIKRVQRSESETDASKHKADKLQRRVLCQPDHSDSGSHDFNPRLTGVI
jgi:hypothetical protein